MSRTFMYNGVNTAFLVEERVLNILRQWAKDYTVILKDMGIKPGAYIADYETIGNNLRQELNALERQQRTIYDLVERGMYTDEEFKERITEIKQRIENTKNRLKKLHDDRNAAKMRRKAVEEFVPNLKHILEVYSTRASAAAKNKILKEVLESVVYNKEKSGAFKNCSADDFTLIAYPKLPKP